MLKEHHLQDFTSDLQNKELRLLHRLIAKFSLKTGVYFLALYYSERVDRMWTKEITLLVWITNIFSLTKMCLTVVHENWQG